MASRVVITLNIVLADRENRGLGRFTLKDLAKEVGVSRQTLSRMLSNTNEMVNLTTLGKIARVLGVNVCDLIGEIDEE